MRCQLQKSPACCLIVGFMVIQSTTVMLAQEADKPAAALDVRRAREWRIPFAGETGPQNAITDVKGVLAGRTMTGKDGNSVHALPTEEVIELLKAAGRVAVQK